MTRFPRFAPLFLICISAAQPQTPTAKTFANSLGMRFVRIDAGSFQMGESSGPLPEESLELLTYHTRAALQKRFPFGDPARLKVWLDHARLGDFDERPVHSVRITQPFHMAVTEVTNAAYEQFDPAHRRLRGKNGFSTGDNEAVVFISWAEAKAFCDWLSKKEGLPYRLPTEAEWEYAARAGTTTPYSTGNTLPAAFHKNPRNSAFDEPADLLPLTTGTTPPNPWGLFDMHGNVEEWCLDWYGPYPATPQTDPVGRAAGAFRVTRGGSHGTPLYFLRSANRMGLPPAARTWITGFRVVLGAMPPTAPLPVPPPQRFQTNVSQTPAPPSNIPPDKPYFRGPLQFVRIPPESHGPLFSHHNHDPNITECPNGDLLAAWYTCIQERGRELNVAISRLRRGATEWEPASLFWDAPDRNDHNPILWFDGKDTIYHFNGVGIAGRWAPLAVIQRKSKDNGSTWSSPEFVSPEFDFHGMIAETVIRTADGSIAMASDISKNNLVKGPQTGTLWISPDQGQTWSRRDGMRGIHPTLVQLRDGSLFALGREEPIEGRMPASLSRDMGRTWAHSPSIFPPITGGQRAALHRLREGPLLLVSFARDIHTLDPTPPRTRYSTNMFAALSFDDGKTWPVRRVISDGKSSHAVFTMDEGRVRMSPNRSEPIGYLSVTQSHDGLIHVLSSINHYSFNLAWLKQPQPKGPLTPQPATLPARATLRPVTMSHTVSANPPRWANDRLDEFRSLDPAKGVTVEARSQVASAFDLDLSIVSGPRYMSHYHLRATPTAVHYLYEGEWRELAANLDNAAAPHTFRMAVRPDTAVQIYRDGQLLATMDAEFGPDQVRASRGSHIEWGATAAPAPHIRFDLSGAYQP